MLLFALVLVMVLTLALVRRLESYFSTERDERSSRSSVVLILVRGVAVLQDVCYAMQEAIAPHGGIPISDQGQWVVPN